MLGPPATLEFVTRPAHYETSDVRIDKIVVGPYENNVFVLRDKHTGDAVLVDAANEHELLLEVSRATGVRRVLTTHGHFDHIQAVTQMRDAGIDVGIATEDAKMLPGYDFVIPDDDVIEVGDLRLRTIHTPGHTPGSTCFLLVGHPVLFSGDTLFPGASATRASKAATSRRSSSRSIAGSSAAGPDVRHPAGTASTRPSAPNDPTSTNGSSAAGSRARAEWGPRSPRSWVPCSCPDPSCTSVSNQGTMSPVVRLLHTNFSFWDFTFWKG